MEKFSKRYETFNEWIVNNIQDTPYTRRIKRLHNIYPDANLRQLRGHAKKMERNLRKQKPTPVGQRPYSSLSPREKMEREKSLGALKDMRRGKSLAKASRERGITINKVLALQVFLKIRGRWRAPFHDNIQRALKINENGREVVVVVGDSRIASLIGSYHSYVGIFLDRKDYSGLAAFQHVTFTDIYGRYHRFETNPIALKRIAESREDMEFYDIYAKR